MVRFTFINQGGDPIPADTLVGKPVTVTLPSGEKKVIGKVVKVQVTDGTLYLAAKLERA